MTTISARIDDRLKAEADEIAEAIGVSLSAAITIFLKKFVNEQGFPFEVKAPVKEDITSLNTEAISFLVKQSIKESSDLPNIPKSAYIDPQTHQLIIPR